MPRWHLLRFRLRLLRPMRLHLIGRVVVYPNRMILPAIGH
jgi:hypothetical protein